MVAVRIGNDSIRNVKRKVCKMLKKDLYEMLGVREKTARETIKLAEAVELVKDTLTPEMKKEFESMINSMMNDKKNGISQSQIELLSKEDPETIRRTIAAVLENPKEAKRIVTEALKEKTETKTTVTLPEYINRWYTEKAKKNGKSKSQYIAGLLKYIYLSEIAEEETER